MSLPAITVTQVPEGHGLSNKSSALSPQAPGLLVPPSPISRSASGSSSTTVFDEGIALTSKEERSALEDPSTYVPFSFGPRRLASLLDPKDLAGLRNLGGTEALLEGLGAHRARGLTTDSAGEVTLGPVHQSTMEDRQRVYGANTLPVRDVKSLLQLMWLALQDKVLILLSIAAVVSLALGLYQDLGTPPTQVPCSDDITKLCDKPRLDFVEGVAIVVAIMIVVLVGSVNDWQKEKQFQKLNEKKDDRGVKVIRDGKERVINVKEVVVGDIALLEPGEIIPCDGIFLSGHNVRCDESGATGESDAIKKVPLEQIKENENHTDCFMLSGSKVIEGVGQYVVVAVGQRSFNGRILMDLQGDPESTPLQLKLNDLANLIAKIAGICGLLLFTALMIKFFVQLATNADRSSTEKAMNFVKILIISVTLVVVAVPEGLPLAVTLALAFATKRMTKENLLVRALGSCETMANATVICTDKTGTLTQNSMTVVAGSIGVHLKFVANLEHHVGRSNAAATDGEGQRLYPEDSTIDQTRVNDSLSDDLQDLLNQAIAINSTAFEDKHPDTGALEFVGSKTETALLRFAKDLQWADYQATREAAQTVQMIPFSSDRKAMGVVIRLPDNRYRLFLKGASEILTALCSSHVVVGRDATGISTSPISEDAADNISSTITFFANQTLRTIALCYRDFDPSEIPSGSGTDEGMAYTALAQDLTLISITAIEDPLRPTVRDAVRDCTRAGVRIKMCTGDNVLTAQSIALQCGIYTPGGLIMEGPAFRALSHFDRLKVVPHLQVLARSSPEDKKILVEALKSLGEVVGVTGDGTNDGPALKTADVGFAMGIAGTEVAKEASDIILMDDNFASIVSAIMWGRCVNDAVRKFLQFQISVNITAVLITFITAVQSDEEQSVLTAVQLLWINIIMDTFAALALATDPASVESLDRQPERKTAPLFSIDMTKQILGQALYQTFIVLLFHFLGAQILGTTSSIELNAVVFNIFVFCQIFNSINCRRLDNRLNIFEGLSRNYYFIVITLIEVAIQIIIIFVGSTAFSVTRISGMEWGISIALGFVSIPLGVLIRLIPNGPIERFAIRTRLMADPKALPTTQPGIGPKGTEKAPSRRPSFMRRRGNRFGRLHKAGGDMSSFVFTTIAMSSPSIAWGNDRISTSRPSSIIPPSHGPTPLHKTRILMHPETQPDDPVRNLIRGSPEMV